MNLIDILILAWLIATALRGYSIGLLRQLLSFGGFVLGLAAGGWLAPFVLQHSQGAPRLLIAFGLALLIAAMLAGVGDGIGLRLQSRLKLPLAHYANAALGVVIGAVFVLVSSWLIASALTRLPFADISLAIERSAIIRVMNRVLPSAPGVDRLGRLITPYGLPDVFVGPEPEVDPAGPPSTPEVEAAAAAARGSTVRIEGFACGGISTGSGYVAAPTYVVTNAHVVAGVREPIVFNQGIRQRAAIVWFDPQLDFAVLRTEAALPGTPLPLAAEVQRRGTSVAVVGYPGGGPLKVSPSVVLRSQLALGRDIYGSSLSTRQVYVLQSDIAQGNSGGPVVTAEGRVAGVVFGKAVTRQGIGYAITAQDFADELGEALGRTAAVSSGPCMQ